MDFSGNGEDDEDDSNADYADVLSSDYQIDRKHIQMIDSLGNGQFGEVYRGILKVKKEKDGVHSSMIVYVGLDRSTIRNQYCYQNM